jgi:hypothetical protein
METDSLKTQKPDSPEVTMGHTQKNTEGNCYKVATIITPGGEFLDGKRIINRKSLFWNFQLLGAVKDNSKSLELSKR